MVWKPAQRNSTYLLEPRAEIC